MDRIVYLAMTGASQTLNKQATVAHNLANATTTAFRAETNSFRAVPVFGDGLPTRAFVMDATVGADFAPGAIQQTGRDLDVAVQGSGWIAVQRDDGSEALTRAGSLQVSANGLLQTREGKNVAGDGGTIAIPPDSRIAIATDGTVSVIPNGSPKQVATVGRIKLVDPAESQLVRGGDGLFSLKDGSTADADGNVKLIGGALEGSNVNVVTEMVNMISLARQFDMQMKILQTADANERQSALVMNMNG